VYCCGNEDWFGIGLAADMDHFFDSYLDLVSLPPPHAKPGQTWTAEGQLFDTLLYKRGICMFQHNDIWMVQLRMASEDLAGATYTITGMPEWRTINWTPKKMKNDWVEKSVG